MYQESYLFVSDRLGFRTWKSADVEALQEINSDTQVMEFFPAVSTLEQTAEFVNRMNKQYKEKGFCYYAVDKLDGNEFIGFIGISEQIFDSEFTPCLDIGWRLKSTEWNKGYASEGATRCLEFARNTLGLHSIYSIAPIVNTKSIHIMKKIGLVKKLEFDHPKLLLNERLKKCVLYSNEGQ